MRKKRKPERWVWNQFRDKRAQITDANLAIKHSGLLISFLPRGGIEIDLSTFLSRNRFLPGCCFNWWVLVSQWAFKTSKLRSELHPMRAKGTGGGGKERYSVQSDVPIYTVIVRWSIMSRLHWMFVQQMTYVTCIDFFTHTDCLKVSDFRINHRKQRQLFQIPSSQYQPIITWNKSTVCLL